nr:DNA methyltransferase [Maribacter sp. Hal144]
MSRVEKGLTPEETDQLLVKEIEHATAENSDVWTCPDSNRREYCHSFFQYPAMMVPAVQKKLIDIVSSVVKGTKNMIDPMMGSATTLVASMENGLNCYGQDINPLAVLISKVRTGPFLVEGAKQQAMHLMKRIESDKNDKIEKEFKGINKWFKPVTQQELSKIVRGIREEENLNVRRFFWVVLAETVRVSSNDRTSTFKLHIRPEDEIDRRVFSAIDVFALHLDKTLEDYEAHTVLLANSGQLVQESYRAEVHIRIEDSKASIYCPTKEPFYDLLVTSPPYGDNKTTVTYGQYSYLPLQWIDLNDIDAKATEDFLRTTLEIDSRSLGGKLTEIDSEKVDELCKQSPSFLRTRKAIEKVNDSLVKKVDAFLLDLNQTIANIFEVMKPNSYQIWTVGNRRVGGIEIPNAAIITELIEKNRESWCQQWNGK